MAKTTNAFGLTTQQMDELNKTGNYTKTNTLATNATKSASQVTQETLKSVSPIGPVGSGAMFQVGGAENTINGKAIPTSGTNDPSMFAIPQGDGLTVAQRSAKYNSPSTTPTSGGSAGAGGGGISNPMDLIMKAYTDSLRAGSAQSLQNQRDAVAASFQANQIQNQLNSSLTDLISASQSQAAASQDLLTKTLAGMSSGSKGVQTGMEAVDVSEQMAAEDSKRRDLRRTSAADTKKVGLLSQKAMLSKPTLLGL